MHHASASIIFSKTTITRKKKNVQCSGKRKCSSSGTGCHTAHAGSFQNFPSSSWLLLMVLRLVSRVVCYLGFSVTRSDAVRCFSLHLFLGCFRTFESVLKTLLGTAKTIFLHVENIFTFSVLHVLGTFQHEVPNVFLGLEIFWHIAHLHYLVVYVATCQ